jgi:transcriptional regulator with XRE-family HTH domain
MITDTQALDNIKQTVRLLIGEHSFAEIAKQCCTDDWVCHPGTIEKIANGRNMPRASLLARVAQALGTTMDAMVYGHHLRGTKSLPGNRTRRSPSTVA